MTWQPPTPKRGWRRLAADTVTRVSHTIHMVGEVVAGGKIVVADREKSVKSESAAL